MAVTLGKWCEIGKYDSTKMGSYVYPNDALGERILDLYLKSQEDGPLLCNRQFHV